MTPPALAIRISRPQECLGSHRWALTCLLRDTLFPPEPSERPPPLRLDPRGPAEHLVQQRTGKSVGTGEQGARPNPQAAEQQQKTNPDPPSSSFPIVTSQECGAFYRGGEEGSPLVRPGQHILGSDTVPGTG